MTILPSNQAVQANIHLVHSEICVDNDIARIRVPHLVILAIDHQFFLALN